MLSHLLGGQIGKAIKYLLIALPDPTFMDLTKQREEERLRLLENRMIDRCDEISEISFSLLSLADPERKAQRERRLSELRLELQYLWRQYIVLVPNKLQDLSF